MAKHAFKLGVVNSKGAVVGARCIRCDRLCEEVRGWRNQLVHADFLNPSVAAQSITDSSDKSDWPQFCVQSASRMRVGARLAARDFALLAPSSATSWTADSELKFLLNGFLHTVDDTQSHLTRVFKIEHS